MVANKVHRKGGRTRHDSVDAAMVAALDMALGRAGIATAGLKRDCGLPANHLPQRIPATVFSSYYFQAMQLLKDESCGGLARPLKPGTLVFLAEIMTTSSCLQKALERAVGLFRILDNELKLELRPQAMQTQLVVHYVCGDDPVRLFFLECLLVTLHRLSSWMLGDFLSLDRVQLACPAPVHHKEHGAMFRCPVSYGAEVHALTFRTLLLEQAVTRSKEEVRRLLEMGPLMLLRTVPEQGNYVIRVRNLLRQQLPKHLSQVEIARHLGLAEQTLRRRLHEQGQSFRSVKDSLLLELAKRYLAHQDRSLTEIAALLGYSEPSAFNRAFKGWSGQTPGQFREQLWQQHSAERVESVNESPAMVIGEAVTIE